MPPPASAVPMNAQNPSIGARSQPSSGSSTLPGQSVQMTFSTNSNSPSSQFLSGSSGDGSRDGAVSNLTIND